MGRLQRVCGMGLLALVLLAAGCRTSHGPGGRATIPDDLVTTSTATLQKRADRGDLTATRILGYRSFFGQGQPIDHDAGMAFWRTAADAGDPLAMAYLGWAYRDPWHSEYTEFEEGEYWLRLSADAGNETGQVQYAIHLYFKNDPTLSDEGMRRLEDLKDTENLAAISFVLPYQHPRSFANRNKKSGSGDADDGPQMTSHLAPYYLEQVRSRMGAEIDTLNFIEVELLIRSIWNLAKQSDEAQLVELETIYQRCVDRGAPTATKWAMIMYGGTGIFGTDGERTVAILEQSLAMGDVDSGLKLARIFRQGKLVEVDLPRARAYLLALAAQGQGRAYFELVKVPDDAHDQAPDWNLMDEATELILKAPRVRGYNGLMHGAESYLTSSRNPADPIPDVERAERLLDLAIAGGSESALEQRIRIYFEGGLREYDGAEVRRLRQRAREMGMAEQTNLLGVMLLSDDGGEVDAQGAWDCFVEAREGGVAIAAQNMAWMIRYELLEPIDDAGWERVRALYHEAAEGGEPEAMNELGMMLIYGVGGEQDWDGAEHWLLEAADADDVEAMRNLGFLYSRMDTPQPKEAVAWYRRAASAGDTEAWRELGKIYHYGIGIEADESRARRYYRRAIRSGDVEASTAMGNLVYGSAETEKAMAEAITYYEAAAEADEPVALYMLGKIYDEGYLIEADLERALAYYRRSAEAGDVDAMVLLGDYYSEGDTLDFERSRDYYMQAIEADGSLVAVNNLAWLYEWQSDEPERAVALYTQSGEAGNSMSWVNLGRMYQRGALGEVQSQTALAYLHRAEAMDDDAARYEIARCYYYGGPDLEPDLAVARQWLEKAGRSRPDALNWLGYMLQHGEGGEVDTERAIAMYQRATDGGDGAGAYNIGWMYHHGDGVPQDYAKARHYMQQAMELGDVDAHVFVPLYPRYGLGMEQDPAAAKAIYEASFADGVGVAANAIGMMYWNGELGEVDLDAAAEWYERSVQAGYLRGMLNLGKLYTDDPDQIADCAIGIAWLERAFDAGLTEASDELGWIYLNGWGVDTDLAAGRAWLERGVAAGDPIALRSLALVLSDEAYGETDFARAKTLLLAGAEVGEAGAMYDLGAWYLYGTDGSEPDVDRAFDYYSQAVEAGWSDAANEIGYMYTNGDFGDVEYAEAMAWFERGVAMENATSMYNMGVMYKRGYAVDPDPAAAAQWFLRALEIEDHVAASYNLGEAYETGEGVEADRERARQYYRQAEANPDALYALARLAAEDAAAADTPDYTAAWDYYERADAEEHADAPYAIGQLYEAGHGRDADVGAAIDAYERAATRGNASAMARLGDFYAAGEAVPQNLELALQLYRDAAAAGNDDVLLHIGRFYEDGIGVAADPAEARRWYGVAVDRGVAGAAERLQALGD